MADVLVTVVVAAFVGLAVFGGVLFVLGRIPGLSDPVPDGVPRGLPDDRPITAEDVRHVRFDTAPRGYRMDQVDAALRRVSQELPPAAKRLAPPELVAQAQQQPESERQTGSVVDADDASGVGKVADEDSPREQS
ncbi:MAG: DivIVA domain-containing protein [Corynebacteriales bacterium]|nr:DivIVA domain-containing protein [Mycobacteriales bacterium]